MGVVQVRLQDAIRHTFARQVAAGRPASAEAPMIEAARRFAEDLAVAEKVML